MSVQDDLLSMVLQLRKEIKDVAENSEELIDLNYISVEDYLYSVMNDAYRSSSLETKQLISQKEKG